MDVVRALDAVAIGVGLDLEGVGGVDALHHQGLAVELDLAGDLGPETTASGGDAARLQRAPEGAGQSATGRRDQVVQRGRLRR